MAVVLGALLFIFTKAIQAQYLTCLNGGVGICIAGRCASPTQICIPTTTGPICCESNLVSYSLTPSIVQPVVPQVVVPSPVVPVQPQIGVPTATCFDRVDPRTGVTDCPSKAYLCNNPQYYALMTQQCPLTCNRCTGTVAGTTTCQDFVDPRTGASTCPQLVAYCRNALYAQLMREQCPRTCGYCI